MRILVCLKEAPDTRLNLAFSEVDDALHGKNLACGWNGADAAALSAAIKIRSSGSDEIIVLTIAQQKTEWLLRDALAAGTNRAIRIEDDCHQPYSPYTKARILARAGAWLKADLVLTGVSGGDSGSRTVGPYTAARLGWPFLYGAVQLTFNRARNSLMVLRDIGQGRREVVECALPAVIAIGGDGRDLPYADLDAIVASREAPIERLSPADVGTFSEELRDEPARVRRLSSPRPRPQPAPLDSSLPAFDRILALLAGGMQTRKVKMLEGDTPAIVEQLFGLLIEKQVLKPNLNRQTTDAT